MTENKKYSTSSRRDFLRYLEGNLSNRERNRIERELMRDPFDEAAMEGLSMIGPDEVREDLDILDQQIIGKVSKRKPGVWFRVAAAVAVLLALSITFVTVFDDRISLLDRKVAETEDQNEKVKMEKSEIREEKLPALESEVISTPKPESIIEPMAIEMEEDEETSETHAGEDAEILLENEKDVIAVADDEIAGEFMMETGEVMAAGKMVAGPESIVPAPGHRMLSGMVVSEEDSQPLAGVNLMLKETSLQTVSDMSGNFELPVPDDSINTLIANYVGMQSKEISITDQSDLEIMLQPDQASMDEVVMVAYQESKKSRRSPAMPSMAASDTEGSPSSEPPAPYSEEDKFREYVEANIRFPEDSQLNRAVVVLGFDVGQDGRPRDITVLESPADSFSQEAIRLLNDGPGWEIPAPEIAQSGQSTSVRIVFKK